MDIAIKVVVALFVSLAVGAMIIMFARQALDDARLNLKSYNVKEDQYVLDLGTVTPSELRALIEQCQRDKKEAALEKELCYVIRADIQVTPKDLGTFPFPANLNFTKGNNALFIYYDIYAGAVSVEK